MLCYHLDNSYSTFVERTLAANQNATITTSAEGNNPINHVTSETYMRGTDSY